MTMWPSSACRGPATSRSQRRRSPRAVGARLAHAAVEAPFAVWQWLTIRAGIPVVTAAVQDQLDRAIGQLGPPRRHQFQEGLLYRAGDHRADAVSRSAQKERLFAFHTAASVVAGARLFGSVFGDQPCGVVVNAAPAPGAGTDLLAVVPFAAIAEGGAARGRAGRPGADCPSAAVRGAASGAGARGRWSPRVASRMCLALIALDAHPRHTLVIAANRDEHHARAAAPASWWRKGGSPAGTSSRAARGSRFAATGASRFVTNVREPGLRDVGAPSRGALVTRVVADGAPTEETVARVLMSTAGYNGYNLVAGDGNSACWGSNRAAGGVRRLRTGVHGISNAVLDAPWPKVRRTSAAMTAWCRNGDTDVELLFARLPIERWPQIRSCRRPASRPNGNGGCRRRSSSAPTSVMARAAPPSSRWAATATRISSSAPSTPTAIPSATSTCASRSPAWSSVSARNRSARGAPVRREPRARSGPRPAA